MRSQYEIVLAELKLKREKLAKKYVPRLYMILRNEEHLPSEECRAKVQRDCGEMWAEDTIRKHLPAEAKNEVRRKAGKISAEIRKKQRNEESLSANVNAAGQSSLILRTDGDNFAGSNPTENGSVRRKEQESRPEGFDKPTSYCAGCNEKGSFIEKLQNDLDLRNLEIFVLEGQVDELKGNSREGSETIVPFSYSLRFEELRYQLEQIFKGTDGVGNVWLNVKLDIKKKKIVELTISAVPANRTSDSIKNFGN